MALQSALWDHMDGMDDGMDATRRLYYERSLMANSASGMDPGVTAMDQTAPRRAVENVRGRVIRLESEMVEMRCILHEMHKLVKEKLPYEELPWQL